MMALLRWPACLKRAALLTGLVGPQARAASTRGRSPGGFGRQDESTLSPRSIAGMRAPKFDLLATGTSVNKRLMLGIGGVGSSRKSRQGPVFAPILQGSNSAHPLLCLVGDTTCKSVGYDC